MSEKTTTKKRGSAGVGSLQERDYAARIAAFRRARGALAGHGPRLIRELAKLRKERERPLPPLRKR